MVKPESPLAAKAHPPIDRILLTNLSKVYDFDALDPIISPWSKLNIDQYFKVIRSLRSVKDTEDMVYFWMIEKYWSAA